MHGSDQKILIWTHLFPVTFLGGNSVSHFNIIIAVVVMMVVFGAGADIIIMRRRVWDKLLWMALKL